ncbi:geranylgeranyl pyrophosphate synthetase [Apodospora peruviana]|uniref:Geranylgeranyl pyrophosphate synthetase n=1 Tax=Apodospora peruviana TaxID=516989 RepID=A0AAE0ITJ3_9PEZI|nr:geranylgeranyl pyrophosphate synthetase [Apodospora peruviana]
MPACQHCPPGRVFTSEVALIHHQAAKHSHLLSSSTQQPGSSGGGVNTGRPPPSIPGAPLALVARNSLQRRDNWIYKGLRGRDEEPIHLIDLATLQPSATPVSGATSYELVCSYNWLSGSGAGFLVPGHAPVWQDLALPVSVPKIDNRNNRKPSRQRHSYPAWHSTKYPFEQVFQATASMSPDFRFSDVDIVTTRNSLRKLLNFCRGRSQDSFRINLSLVADKTLLIEQHDSKSMASRPFGWGHEFERTFTKFPPGLDLDRSTSHDRFLQYPLGELNCVVGFELDACYYGETEQRQEADVDAATGLLEELALEEETPLSEKRTGVMSQVMPQDTAAELKSKTKGSTKATIGTFLPQLWFGRTPWLIVGSHTEGTFFEISVTDVVAAGHFTRWETERQADLRKLVAVLGELRDAVRRRNNACCAAVYEKDVSSTQRVIKMCALANERMGVPAEVVRQFWEAEG